MNLEIPYIPLPAAEKAHESSATAKLGVGGKGSGKTNWLLHEAFMLSMEYPGNQGVLGRETYGETEEILIDPMLNEIVPDVLIEDYRKKEKILIFTNKSRIYFRSLDEARKMKGKNLGFFGIDELDAVGEDVWLQLIGQLRRPGVWRVALATTNPTTIDHWIYERFVREQLPGYEVFRFPTRENIHLPKSFVDNLYITMPESWVKRYLEGLWGSISLGDRVYADFSEKIHQYDNLVYNSSIPILRSWDFGLNGSAVVYAQRRGAISLDVLGESFRRNLPSRQFAQYVARYSEANFPGAVFEDMGDIAGWHKDATSGTSPIEETKDELKLSSFRTNPVPLKDSLDLVRIKLAQISEGQAGIRVSPKARVLIEGFNGGYVLKHNKDGTLVQDVPASDATFEHPQDAFRYLIWDQFRMARIKNKKPFKMPDTTPIWPDTSW